MDTPKPKNYDSWIQEREAFHSLQTKWEKTLLFVGKCLLVIAFVGWMGWFELDNYYFEALPHMANAVTGNTYALNHHGVGLYLTKEENTKYFALQYSSLTIGFCAFVLLAVLKWRGNRERRARSFSVSSNASQSGSK